MVQKQGRVKERRVIKIKRSSMLLLKGSECPDYVNRIVSRTLQKYV